MRRVAVGQVVVAIIVLGVLQQSYQILLKLTVLFGSQNLSQALCEQVSLTVLPLARLAHCPFHCAPPGHLTHCVSFGTLAVTHSMSLAVSHSMSLAVVHSISRLDSVAVTHSLCLTRCILLAVTYLLFKLLTLSHLL